MQVIQSIPSRIYEIRGERVILDLDVASLYDVEIRALNLAVIQHAKRFPEGCMFQLHFLEYDLIKDQVKELQKNPSSQIAVIDSLLQNRSDVRLPYAFTALGLVMLSSVLSSVTAINMNIAIARTYTEARRALLKPTDVAGKLKEIKKQLGGQDEQLNQLYDALENLLDAKASGRKWAKRKRIGF
jgi:hypothetical protein